jgi:hypothetical protein
MVHVVAEEKAYNVVLASADELSVSGFFRYIGERLPEPDQIIELQSVLNPGDHPQARVTRVVPDDERPIYATRQS